MKTAEAKKASLNSPLRWDCSLAPEQDFINVTWKVSYSGRTVGKLLMAQLPIAVDLLYDHNQTERARILEQDGVELIRERICSIDYL
jgi:hypothetical protein